MPTESLVKSAQDEHLSAATKAFLREGRFGHVIDGETCLSDETFPVYDPATGREFARCAAGTRFILA